MALKYYVEDCKELLLQIKEQETTLRFKRRWLMDLPVSKKLMKKLNPLTDKTISEIFLREDDAYYTRIKLYVQKVLGVRNSVKEEQVADDVRSVYSNYILKNLSSLLDKMTIKGLFCFTELVTDGLVEFEKTRRKMKKIVKKYLPIFLNEQNYNFQTRMKQISCLLKNHENFNGHYDILGSSTKSRIAAIRLLNELEDLPLQTLRVMSRKLNGDNGHIPELGSYKHEQKSNIIGTIKNCCMTMLSELHEGEDLPESLVKALVVAGLTLKLILGRPSVPELQKFSQQIESLQSDIATAICLVGSGCKVRPSEIGVLYRKLPHLDGSEVTLSQKSMRAALSYMLMDFLFECSDMEILPESLLEAVFAINKRAHDSDHRSALKDKVEQEVELLLGFSAQIKQLVWDLVPELEVDEDFANACMGEFEETDDDEEGLHLAQNHELCSDDSKSLSESFGETIPFNSRLLMSAGTGDGISLVLSPDRYLNCKLQSVHITERDTNEPYDFRLCSSLESEMLEKAQSCSGNLHQLASYRMRKPSDVHSFSSAVNQVGSSVSRSPGRTKVSPDVKTEETMYDSTRNAEVLHSSYPTGQTGGMQHELCSNRNKYLSIQKACDDTSMAMYHIIGGMLAEFAQARHLHLSHDDLAYLQSHASVPDDSKGTRS